jgi:hypothetical protein
VLRGICCLCVLLGCAPLQAYSVLTHEAIIDTSWKQQIEPQLLNRYPDATPEQLHDAHAYAYGGCIIQDMGYYPFGSKFFTDLAHYVRSGDFIINLLREAQDLDEYAFALGALAHYAADTQGHSIGINRSVPLVYPKLEAEFGPVVTYADDKTSHLRVEFSFDVLQVARGSYAPQAYHDFIGFKVAKPVLERAFRDTYSLEMNDIFKDLDLALSTYRYAVSQFIPYMTQVAWKTKKDELVKAQPGLVRRKFVYRLSRAEYRKSWNEKYQHPGPGATVLAFVIRILPKVGPLKVLAFKPPTPQAEKLFETSFLKTLDVYADLLKQQRSGQLQLPNRDFDTGHPTARGEYRLADATFGELAQKLAEQHDPASVDPELRRTIVAFYGNGNADPETKQKPEEWRKTMAAVAKLRDTPVPH